MPTGDTHLGWRLKCLAETGRLVMQGDTTKTLKDFDVKLPGGEAAGNAEAAQIAAPAGTQ